jgi:hypothetical protein
MSFTGSCHCGALRYSCASEPGPAMTCTCSICRRKGAVLYFADPADVRLTADPEALGTYRFHRHVIAHHFCRTCGIAVWAEVAQPDGTTRIALNLRTADLDLATISTFAFDGATAL